MLWALLGLRLLYTALFLYKSSLLREQYFRQSDTCFGCGRLLNSENAPLLLGGDLLFDHWNTCLLAGPDHTGILACRTGPHWNACLLANPDHTGNLAYLQVRTVLECLQVRTTVECLLACRSGPHWNACLQVRTTLEYLLACRSGPQ